MRHLTYTQYDRTNQATAFGLGGSNSHVILDSADSFGLGPRQLNGFKASTSERPRPSLLAVSANLAESAKTGARNHAEYIQANPKKLDDVAHTLALHREHFPWRTFAVSNGETAPEFAAATKIPPTTPNVYFVFTGQGAQWAGMGARLLEDFPSALADLEKMDEALSTLDAEVAPSWTLKGLLPYGIAFTILIWY